MNYILYGILGALLLAHVIVAMTATIVVLRDKSLERFQTISKILASWVVLYAGPLFILYVMNEHSPELIPSSRRVAFCISFSSPQSSPHRTVTILWETRVVTIKIPTPPILELVAKARAEPAVTRFITSRSSTFRPYRASTGRAYARRLA